MTGKQEQFVAEYLIDLNSTQAAIRAGYSANTAEQQGYENLRKPEIARAIAEGKAKQLKSADLSAARVLEELRRLAFSNVRDLFDEAGNLRPIHLLTPEQSACISSLEVIKKNAEAGDGHIDVVHKLKVWDKTRTLEMLAKHFALLTEKIAISASGELMDRLDRGRLRAARKL